MSIAEKIKSILVSDVYVEVPADRMKEDDSMRDVFGVDSLGFVELRVQVEDAFGISISDDEFTPENFATIRSLSTLVESRQLSGSPAAS